MKSDTPMPSPGDTPTAAAATAPALAAVVVHRTEGGQAEPVRLVPKPISRQGSGLRTLLVNLPWASWRRPSIQMGLLGALGRRAGHTVSSVHLNLDLAAHIGKAAYELVCDHRSTALGEWLFSRAAFGDAASDPQAFLEQHAGPIEAMFERRGEPLRLDALVEFREHGAQAWIERCLAEGDWHEVQLFGLSSTFQQNNACFAFARIVKLRFPDALVVAGGANFDATMGAEWMRAVPALDLVVSGEADRAFPLLLDRLADGGDLCTVPNLLQRGVDADGLSVVVRSPHAEVFRELDSLPTPSYDEYFERAESLGLLPSAARRNIDLPFETSRGCWWGERRHCTFCGLNGQTMSFRSKSAGRVAQEMAELASRYRSFRFAAVDNILDLKFHKTLLPAIEASRSSYDIFFEVKSGLSSERLHELKAAGIGRIQPGIESLSTHVLRLMDKGVTALHNVNLLRWSAQLGIDVSWNIIWGFPGETQQDYQTQLDWLRRITHLQPPVGAGRIWLERFSPLFQARCREQRPPQPERSLRLAYPAHVDLQQAAYFFEYDFDSDVDPGVWQATLDHVEAWKAHHGSSHPPSLVHHYSPGFLQIDEGRPEHACGTYTFESPYAELYMSLVDKPRPVAQLEQAAPGTSAAAVELFVRELTQAGLLLQEGGMAMALSLPASGRDRRRSGAAADAEPQTETA